MNKYKNKNEVNYSSQFNELTKEESIAIQAGGNIGEFLYVIKERIREIFS
ncbi:hypothetical protein QTL86_17720 [Cellulosilyticum sp. ST5]|nr:hypothetical protein [Cellulosilyticum sp. WCF-2]